MSNNLKYIVVVGGSAGGLAAASGFISGLDKDLNTAVFVVLHVAKSATGDVWIQQLQKHTSYTCVLAEDKLPIKSGHIYFAHPDYHLILKENEMRITKGPHENRWRPSIDILFRSAAANYGSRAIGIVLTGLLDDGSSGMSAIKRCGGVCIVQEPNEAEFSDMPLNVLNNVDVDYRVQISDMGYVLKDIFSKDPKENVTIPYEIKLESDLSEKMITTMDELEKLGNKSDFTCPDCGGTLYTIKEGRAHRYRCYTGHAYSENILSDKQTEGLEESLWVSIRLLEQKKKMLKHMADHDKDSDVGASLENLKKAGEMEKHIIKLKELLITLNTTSTPGEGFL